MFALELPWWEPLLRGVLIYLAVLALLRIFGKRQIGQFTPYDILLLLLISECVSQALSGGDSSLTASAILVVTLLALNGAVGWLGTRWRRFDRVLEGRPCLLLRDGRVDYALLRRAAVSHNELLAALRAAGCFTPHQAEYAVLESSGQISVRRKAPERRGL